MSFSDCVQCSPEFKAAIKVRERFLAEKFEVGLTFQRIGLSSPNLVHLPIMPVATKVYWRFFKLRGGGGGGCGIMPAPVLLVRCEFCGPQSRIDFVQSPSSAL